MRRTSAPVQMARTLSRDLLWPIAMFPLWWYGSGLIAAARFVGREFVLWGQRLSLRLLWQNLLRPMYGDVSKTGRAISLVLRLFIFIARLVVFFFWVVILVLIFIFYIIFPAATLAMFIRSLLFQ